MEGKVDKTIVKSILVAFGIIVAIIIIISVIIGILSAQANDSAKTTNERANCMNIGGCWVNDECQVPCGG